MRRRIVDHRLGTLHTQPALHLPQHDTQIIQGLRRSVVSGHESHRPSNRPVTATQTIELDRPQRHQSARRAELLGIHPRLNTARLHHIRDLLRGSTQIHPTCTPSRFSNLDTSGS